MIGTGVSDLLLTSSIVVVAIKDEDLIEFYYIPAAQLVEQARMMSRRWFKSNPGFIYAPLVQLVRTPGS